MRSTAGAPEPSSRKGWCQRRDRAVLDRTACLLFKRAFRAADLVCMALKPREGEQVVGPHAIGVSPDVGRVSVNDANADIVTCVVADARISVLVLDPIAHLCSCCLACLATGGIAPFDVGDVLVAAAGGGERH